MIELVKKIRKFEEKSGLKLYDEIMFELGKIEQQIKRLRESRENWKTKYYRLKKANQ